LTDVLFLSAVGLFALALQTTSFGFLVRGAYKPELMMILVVWASLRISFLKGAGFAFLSGIFVDMLSGSPIGLCALIYTILFVVCGYFNATFDIDYPMGRALTIFLATLAAGWAVMLMRWLDAPLGFGWQAVSWVLLKSLATAVAALVVLPVLDRLWTGISGVVGVR